MGVASSDTGVGSNHFTNDQLTYLTQVTCARSRRSSSSRARSSRSLARIRRVAITFLFDTSPYLDFSEAWSRCRMVTVE